MYSYEHSAVMVCFDDIEQWPAGSIEIKILVFGMDDIEQGPAAGIDIEGD